MKQCQHLIIDAQRLGSTEELADGARMVDFLGDVVTAAGMKILGGPDIYEGHQGLPGLSGVVVIETSHINIHTFTQSGDIRFDIYSCKPFEPESIKQLFSRYYPCESMTVQTVNRTPVCLRDYE